MRYIISRVSQTDRFFIDDKTSDYGGVFFLLTVRDLVNTN